MTQDIIIAVSESGTAQTRTFDYIVTVAGEVKTERTLSPVETSQIREMAMQYLSILHGAGPGGKSYLPILGAGIFHLFLELGWQEFGSKILPGGRLVINSSIPEVLQLPWEQLRLPGMENILGQSDNFSILRRPKSAEGLFASRHDLSPGPLRVLFLAAEPQEFEREESEMLKMAGELDVILQISDTGTPEELKSLAEAFRPHLVHLVGQVRTTGYQALFSMPGTAGRPSPRSAEELAEALGVSGVECLILGGRQSEPTFAQGILSQQLAEHTPLVLAWNGPTASALPFYRSLAKGQSLDMALKAAAREVQKSGEDAFTAFPVLYTTRDQFSGQSRDQSGLFDTQRTASVPASLCKEQPPLPGMTEGYAECFLDRRRDLQQIVPALLDGSTHTLIITGPQGSGKSTLANHLARLLASSGYSLLPIYSSPKNPLSSVRLLEAVIGRIGATGPGGEQERLRDPGLPVKKRLENSMEFLRASRILMVWDDLVLESKTGKITDPILKDIYLQMLKGMNSGRIIITCPSLPNDAAILPAKARELKLASLSETAFIRVLLQDEMVANRYSKGEISYAQLKALHSSVSGNAAHLSRMRRALRTDLTPGDDALAKLRASLSQASRKALSRAAVYDIAMSPAGFAAVAEVQVETALNNAILWQNLSLAYGVGKLWALPSTARDRLLSGLSPDERRHAHKLAGDFLRDMGESGRYAELQLSRLDCLMEARGQYLEAGDLDDARAVTARISGYMEKRGYYSELIRLNQELLGEPHAGPMTWIARSYLNQGDYGRAREWYGRAVEIAPVASAYQGLGMAYLFMGKHDPARENLQKAVDIYVSLGDRAGEAAGLHALASIDMEKNEFEAAHLKLQRIAEISEGLGDLRGLASALQEMARLDAIRRDYEAARPRLLESLQLMQKLGNRTGEAAVLFNLASLYLEKGDLALADQEFQKALSLARENGDRKGEANILHSLGLIGSQEGDKEKAMDHFQEALRIFQDLVDKSGEAGAFFQLGAVAVQRDKIQEGLRLMAMAAVILRSIKSDEVKNVEPLVERLASQLGFTQEQFMVMVQEVLQSYVKDKGWGLVNRASGK